MAKEKNTFTTKEIGAVLNNAVVMTKAAAEDLIPELRMRRLGAYALALVSPVKQDLEEGLLTAEEGVFVLASSALLLHASEVQKTDKLPFLNAAKEALIDAELALNAEEGK